MCILRIALCLELTGLGGTIFGTIASYNKAAYLTQRFIGKAQGVGSHVSNQTDGAHAFNFHTFIQLLRNRHGTSGSQTQTAGCFLLQGRSNKRRRRTAEFFTALYSLNMERICSDGINNSIDLIFTAQFTLFSVFAVVTCSKRSVLVTTVQNSIQKPVFLCNKCINFFFAVSYHSGCNGLNTACRQTTLNLLPQQRRKLIANNSVQNASSLLGIYQVLIDFTGIGNAFRNNAFGNFIKCNALCFFIRQIQQFL